MRLTVTALLIQALAMSLPTAVRAQWQTGAVGVAWDASGTVCNLAVTPGQSAYLYVVAHPTGILANGITGSEFRVSGLPPDWFVVSVTPNPLAVLTLGNPVGPGCNIAFAACQEGSPDVVVLYTIHLVASNDVSPRVIAITGHSTPSNPTLPCPRLTICDAPADWWGCSEGLTAAINESGHCSTSAVPASWSGVRLRYR